MLPRSAPQLSSACCQCCQKSAASCRCCSPPASQRQQKQPPSSARERIAAYNERTTGISSVDRERTIPALASRSYHLPGNCWCDDWIQYFANNHPLVGICCHHRLHPVRTCARVVIFVGSLAFGLLVTNVIWLYFHYNDNETMLTISLGNTTAELISTTAGASGEGTSGNDTLTATATASSVQEVDVTKAMLVLWTLGSIVHAVFDNVAWYLAACACCLPGQSLQHLERYKKFGTHVVTFAAVLVTAFTTFIIVLRAVLDPDGDETIDVDGDLSEIAYGGGGAGDDDGGGDGNGIDLSHAKNPQAYRFLISYAVELALALFVYYPLFATLLFSGILGCGRVPILGGRPYEVMCERKDLEQRDGVVACTDLALRPKSCRTAATGMSSAV